MNDDELSTLVKEPFADVRMTVTLDDVVRRGRTLRHRRRRVRGLTGAVALATGAVAAVALLVPGGQATTARLAAWTVTRDPDGGITVTVNQLKDPAGLQATLRADGVPVRVTFDPLHWLTQPLPAGCAAPKMSDRDNAHLQRQILTPPAILAWESSLPKGPHAIIFGPPNSPVRGSSSIPDYVLPKSLVPLWQREKGGRNDILYINPAAIPPGIGLSIGVDWQSPSSFGYGVDLVTTSPQCTGA
jgi:hypothetical protein